MTDGLPHLELAHVSKRYNQVRAVADLSMGVPRGRVSGLLAPSGAGKAARRASPEGGNRIHVTVMISGLSVMHRKLEERFLRVKSVARREKSS